MNPIQLKFARFKSGLWGRTIDITLGLVLMWWGHNCISPIQDIAFVIGVFAFLAGALNVCWAAPLIGIPFRGKNVPPAMKE